MASDQLVIGFASLSNELGVAESISGASASLARFAVAHLGADVAWVSLQHGDGTRSRPEGADPMLRLLELVGHGLERPEGVLLSSQAILTIDDTRSDPRWPEWGAAAEQAGVRSMRRVGMAALHDSAPSFDLFSRDPNAFGETGTLLRAIGHASIALTLLDRIAHLGDAMQSRAVIAQAQGILMERHGLSAERAMSYLRRQSQETQVKVRDLATELVDEREVAALPDGGSRQRQIPRTP